MTMTDEEGAEYRRKLYALSRTAKINEVKADTEKRLRALLEEQIGKSTDPSKVESFMGEAMAILVEANAALDRLEKGKTQ